MEREKTRYPDPATRTVMDCDREFRFSHRHGIHLYYRSNPNKKEGPPSGEEGGPVGDGVGKFFPTISDQADFRSVQNRPADQLKTGSIQRLMGIRQESNLMSFNTDHPLYGGTGTVANGVTCSFPGRPAYPPSPVHRPAGGRQVKEDRLKRVDPEERAHPRPRT